MTEPAALVFEDRHLRQSELDVLTDRLAATLRKRGVGAGQRVALMASNRPEFIVAIEAIWRVGAAAVLISPAWKGAEVEHALALTEPADAVGDHLVLAGLMPMLHLDEPLAGADFGTRPARTAGDAVLAFSSGTTGLPKAVRHTHASLNAAVRHWRAALGLTVWDRLQVTTPPVAHPWTAQHPHRAAHRRTGQIAPAPRYRPDAAAHRN